MLSPIRTSHPEASNCLRKYGHCDALGDGVGVQRPLKREERRAVLVELAHHPGQPWEGAERFLHLGLHEATLLLDHDVKLVDNSPIRVRPTHERTGLIVRTKYDKRLMPIPRDIRLSIRSGHPKTQKAPTGLPTSDDLLLN